MLLVKAHGSCALCLLLGLVAGSAIFHDLHDVLTRNVATPYQEGKLTFSWGFAFNVLALIAHVLAVAVLASSLGPQLHQTSDDEGPSAPPAQGDERISGESASRGEGGALKEPLLTLEEGGDGEKGRAGV